MFITYLVLFVFVYQARCWSGIGHDAIGDIALRNIKDESTIIFLNDLFETTSIESQFHTLGRWADEISDFQPWFTLAIY